MNLRLESGVMSDGAWEYLAVHKFGAVRFFLPFHI